MQLSLLSSFYALNSARIETGKELNSNESKMQFPLRQEVPFKHSSTGSPVEGWLRWKRDKMTLDIKDTHATTPSLFLTDLPTDNSICDRYPLTIVRVVIGVNPFYRIAGKSTSWA
ncbi:hypothetical protein KDAU_08770 [Dictyobacter aurantiacus]|uniref:Uncharacterized protein n=1 Tax=Dictyobacter aurantiacus TaxID=1936993 RepID=A0A401Z9R2_9CHLR|nr:hypothetical protein KDAU_08770 [Dictyobacter aurantiacus]